MPGERVLIVGETGAGKSTLFRAVAGLWPWGSGTILTPAPETMAFLPQRPYLPLGTLRNAVVYPSPPDAFSDAEVGHALERCGLGNLIPKLDQVERWDKELSLGEQERLAFVRLLLHKPGWVFLDEATAALDEDSQGQVMGLFKDELKNTTVLSIGHRPDLAAYHTRTLQLVHGREGDRLQAQAGRRAASAAALAATIRALVGGQLIRGVCSAWRRKRKNACAAMTLIIAALPLPPWCSAINSTRSGRRPQASRSMLAKAKFPSSKSNFASGAVRAGATAIYLRFF